MILALLFALLPQIEIVSANDTTLTYRERVPLRVALDPATRTFHYQGCPAIRKGAEWVSPAAATLRRYQKHSCVSLRKNEYVTRSEKRVPRSRNHIAVLFLGNSLTYFNEMPKITQAIGARETRPLFVDSVTQSGASLEDLWFRTDALKRIWQEHWDYVVLQERGGSAAVDRGELFYQYIRMFADEVRKSGAKPLLFMTWRRDNEAFFRSASRRENVPLLPVGVAWQDLLDRGEFSRLDWDGSHPNLYGSYLVACSVYVAVYGKPPVGLAFEFRHLANKTEFYDAPLLEQSLSEGQAKAIQRAAWRAAKNP